MDCYGAFDSDLCRGARTERRFGRERGPFNAGLMATFQSEEFWVCVQFPLAAAKRRWVCRGFPQRQFLQENRDCLLKSRIHWYLKGKTDGKWDISSKNSTHFQSALFRVRRWPPLSIAKDRLAGKDYLSSVRLLSLALSCVQGKPLHQAAEREKAEKNSGIALTREPQDGCSIC